MKMRHFPLLASSVLIVFLLLGGGLFVKVGAAESSYRQAVLFAEVLSLVLENYVDPVEAERLLEGAYEGMLSGLDPNGAYLSPEEVRAWKAAPPSLPGGPGFSVLKSGRTVQVVAIAVDSAAAAAGLRLGDQIREIDGQSVKDLSLGQVRRLLQGEPGTSIRISFIRSGDQLAREEVELARAAPGGRAYELDVDDDVAVLRLTDTDRVPLDELIAELDDVRSRGISRLLLDLRNLAEGDPRRAAEIAAIFSDEPRLELRDRSGRLVESVRADGRKRAWPDAISVLVNGATAGAAEAIAALLRAGDSATLFGETTYGLGAEAKLFELESGAGLLVSSSLWGISGGEVWNEDGLEPDEEIRGDGDDYASAAASQLDKTLERVRERSAPVLQDEAA